MKKKNKILLASFLTLSSLLFSCSNGKIRQFNDTETYYLKKSMLRSLTIQSIMVKNNDSGETYGQRNYFAENKVSVRYEKRIDSNNKYEKSLLYENEDQTTAITEEIREIVNGIGTGVKRSIIDQYEQTYEDFVYQFEIDKSFYEILVNGIESGTYQNKESNNYTNHLGDPCILKVKEGTNADFRIVSNEYHLNNIDSIYASIDNDFGTLSSYGTINGFSGVLSLEFTFEEW